jgi:hypothetical protein
MEFPLWRKWQSRQVSGKTTAGRANHPPGRDERKIRISRPGSPTVVVLPPLDQGLYQVFLEAVAVVVPPDVPCPEVGIAVPGVAAASGVAGPVAVSLVAAAAVVSEVADPAVVFVAAAPLADVAEPRASVDTALVFDVLVPVAAVAVEVDSPVRPRFFVFPNIDYYSSSSSSVEAVG